MLSVLKVDNVARHLLGIEVKIHFAVVLGCGLHKQERSLKGLSNRYYFLAAVVADYSLVDVSSCNTYMDWGLGKRLVVEVLFHLKSSQVALDIQSGKYGARRIVIVTQEGSTPGSCNDEPALVCGYFRHCTLHMIDLLLHYLNDGLQEGRLLLGRAVKGILIELDGHCKDCLLEMLPKLFLCFPLFRLTKMTKGSRDVGFEQNLDLLDLLWSIRWKFMLSEVLTQSCFYEDRHFL